MESAYGIQKCQFVFSIMELYNRVKFTFEKHVSGGVPYFEDYLFMLLKKNPFAMVTLKLISKGEI